MKKIIIVSCLIVLLSVASSQAHLVGLGWKYGINGDVAFSALHWHGVFLTALTGEELIIDGTAHTFTSFTSDIDSITGFDYALLNPDDAAYDVGSGTVTVTGTSNDWLYLTVTLAAGHHTISSGRHSNTQWHNLRAAGGGGILTSYEINVPSAVPEPATMLLFGTGLAGLAGFSIRRRKK